MPTIHDSPTRVIKTLSPGQPGTVKLMRQHGPNLVCVRYRLDMTQQRRYTTVELVADAAPRRAPRETLMNYCVRTQVGEKHLRAALQALGAQWDAGRRCWRTTARVVRLLDLQGRATREAPSPAHPHPPTSA